ncbi:MAG: FHA domain-containing protein [Steroidobacter sp.]
MSRQLRILSGVHRGAELALDDQERCLVGSAAQCSVVLFDSQVAPRHCLVQLDDFGLTCRALDAPVSVGERKVAVGEVAKLDDFVPVRCGEAAFAVGPENGDWTIAERALQPRKNNLHAVRSLRQLNPYALFAMVLLGISGVIGLAYATLSDRPYELTANRIEQARAWLKQRAPVGSELTIGASTTSREELLLTGYVRTRQQADDLLSASRMSGFAPRVEVYSIEEMMDSMHRLSQLAQTDCQPQYQGSGQFACATAVSSEAIAGKLRMLAHDVPGLRALQVSVVAPPAAVVAAARAEAPPEQPARLTQKFSVLMFRNQRYLIGPWGERYTEGQQFDGFKINRIGIDKIRFERDGREFEFYVAALRTPR